MTTKEKLCIINYPSRLVKQNLKKIAYAFVKSEIPSNLKKKYIKKKLNEQITPKIWPQN